MVSIVGAGPGATDLITVRGQKLLSQADVIIYAGSLVNPELLAFAKDGCELYNSAYMTLEEVISVMEEAEHSQKQCVRLHTGDPSLYGAVREQMDALEKLGIAYEICPGVSSMFAASAALGVEYTLPDVTQTLIVTRCAGRTPVPDREHIRKLAVHQSTMVLFLSTGHLDTLEKDLVEGGYSPDTPAALVYKASWPQEKVIRCTIATLAKSARQQQITKTALVIIGEVLQARAPRSRLYDPAFSTEYRKASSVITRAGETEKNHAAVIAFTREGSKLAKVIREWMIREGWESRAYTTQKEYRSDEEIQVLTESVQEWTGKRFEDCRAIIFVGAAGIAVRLAAPYVRDKMSDPAVLVVDETAKYVIPLLSGHVGGANQLAKRMADCLGAEAVLTTATEVTGRFAVDSFAVEQRLWISDRKKAKEISADILKGKQIAISCPAGWLQETRLPAQLILTEDPSRSRILIDWHCEGPEKRPLRLVPEKSIWIGVGCRKGIGADQLAEAFTHFLDEQRIDPAALAGLASISLKQKEEGLLAFAGGSALPIVFYEASRLDSLEGDFSDSDFVRNQTGTGNVCERAACMAAGEYGQQTDRSAAKGRLIVRKHKYRGITFAAALADRRIEFA